MYVLKLTLYMKKNSKKFVCTYVNFVGYKIQLALVNT